MSELKASRLRNGPSTDTRPSSAEKKIAISRLKELAGNFERAARRRKANIPQKSQRTEAAPVNRVPTREWRSVRAGLLPLIRMYRQMKVELHDGSLPTISLRQVSVIIGALRVVQSAPLHRIAPHRRQKVLRMIARRIGRLLGVLRGSGEFDERLQQWLKIFQRSERYKKIRYWEREGAAFDRLKVGLMDSSETR
jgi:hypothetical protein